MADAVVRFKPSARSGNPITVATTELNSLANGSGVITSVLGGTGVISNDATDEGDLYADFELYVPSFPGAPTTDSLIELYIVRSVDGANWEDANAEGRPKHGYAGGFVLDNVTTAQRIVLPEVRLPPVDFKLYLVNRSGGAMAASGNIVKAYFYSEQADEA